MTSNIKQFFLQTGLLNEEEVEIVDKCAEISVAFNDKTNNYGLNIKFVDILPVKIFEKLLGASKKQSERFEFQFSGSVKQYSDSLLNDYFAYICKDLLHLTQQLESLLDERNVTKQEQDIIIKYFADTEKVVLDKNIPSIAAYLRLAGFNFDNIKLAIDEKRQGLGLFAEKKQQEIESAIAKSKATDYEMKRLIQENRIRVANFTQLSDIEENDSNVAIQVKIFNIETRISKSKEWKSYTFCVTDNKTTAKIMAWANLQNTKNQFGKPYIITDTYLDTFKKGDWIRSVCTFKLDKRTGLELIGNVSKILKVDTPDKFTSKDEAEVKRSELLCHTNMSAFDGKSTIEDILAKVKSFGWNTVGIVDRDNVHIFPHAAAAAKKTGTKIIYGCELNVLNDTVTIAKNTYDLNLDDAEYVIFDIETTGLYNEFDELIEFGGIKVKNNQIIDQVDFFVKSTKPIPARLVEKTHITNDMIKEQGRDLVPALKYIKEWIGNAVLIAHNGINFDYRFLNKKFEQHKIPLMTNAIIDTMQASRLVNVKLAKHNLGALCRLVKVEYNDEIAHRADFDSKVLFQVWKDILRKLKALKITNLQQLATINTNLFWERQFADNYVIFYVNKKESFKPLYKLVSKASTENLFNIPRVFKSDIKNYRDALTIVNHPFESDVWDNAINGTSKDLENAINFYDVIYVPSPSHLAHVINRGHYSKKEVQSIIKKIVDTATTLKKKVIAVSDSYYLDPWDDVTRRVYIHSKLLGGRSHRLFSYNESNEVLPDNHLRTTNELLNEFSFLGKDVAKQIVVDNANEFASKFPVGLSPIYDKLCPPVIKNAKQLMLDFIEKRKHEIYGDKIPDWINERLQKELDSIVGNNFIVSYWISHLLVKKSNEDGYMVGSRGSVGSSFVAYLLNVTEVNPLKPHYICKKCHHVELSDAADDGFDLPEKLCPVCGEKMSGDGHDIPFETFLGFKGEKTPDIDLNFSGEYQPKAHEYLRQTFGIDKSLRSGTTAEVKEKVAYGYAKSYVEKYEPSKSSDEAYISWLASLCSGVKRTTGQHPGGIIIVPENMEICDFTPYNYPADDKTQSWFTSHFDYHSIESNLYKFDILGHDNPTKMKYLKEKTGFDPINVPFQDPRVMSLFTKIDELNIDPSQIKGETTGALGIPEFGTEFVRRLLVDSQPQNFADLIRIMGLSHGKLVWLGNAQDLIVKNKLTLPDVVCCRDDIMKYLIKCGIEEQTAFSIMESVRKGKGIKENDLKRVKEANVPDWYIDSCIKISYLFPKAHATAYAFDSWRMAWYKLYHALAFYGCYFSIKAVDFDLETCWKGREAIETKMDKIEAFDNSDGYKFADEIKKNDIFKYEVFETMLECLARGYKFGNIDLNKSDAKYFALGEDKKTLIPPFITIPSLGDIVAEKIVKERQIKPFKTKEDLQNRCKLSVAHMEFLEKYGVLDGLAEEDQGSLFDEDF